MEYFISKNNLRKYGPKPFLFINTCKEKDLTFAKILSSLKKLKDCNYGGFILFNKPPTGFNKDNYLSENWFNMVRRFIKAAKLLKLEMWINDGFDYPPGGVAGKVKLLNPNLEQQHVKWIDNKLTVIKEKEFGFPAFENPTSGKLFVELVYEEYNKRFSKYFGKTIKGFFSDADNRRVSSNVTLLGEKDNTYDYFPWTDDFETKFSNHFGYDILPYMKDIIERKNIPQAKDYWFFCSVLYKQWFENNHKWLKDHNLLYTGHTSDSSPFLYKDAPRSSCFSEGRFSDIESCFDFPGTDQEMLAIDGGKHLRSSTWYSPKVIYGEKKYMPSMNNYYDVTHDMRAKQASSTAYMYNKQGCMCEMFAASNYGVSPLQLKQIATFQLMQGVTFVVPHAYHYKFFGETKYFAPPELSRRICFKDSIKIINNYIAKYSFLFSKGQTLCDIALLDPTENIWQNDFNNEPYFKAFNILNRKPQGFIVCDIDKIIKQQVKVQAVIIAGIKINEEQLNKLNKLNIQVIMEQDLDKIDEIVKTEIKYEGEGTPHFLRKKIDNEEFVFLANVESAETICGKLTAFGKTKNITINSGDIIYMSKTYDNIAPEKKATKKVYTFNNNCKVKFKSENVIPLERFETPNGDVVTKSETADKLLFKFTSAEDLKNVRLIFPIHEGKTCKVYFNNDYIKEGKAKFYDDLCYEFKIKTIQKGENIITIEKNFKFQKFDKIFLFGNFDVKIDTDKKEYKQALNYYNLSIFIPKEVKISLSKRRHTLDTTKSWAEQGQPFYSGCVKYYLELKNLNRGKYRLVLPLIRDTVIFKHHMKKTTIAYPPYVYEIKNNHKKIKIALDITNSSANLMECYLEESGLNGKISLEKI